MKDELDGKPALRLPEDTYVVQFDAKTIGVMRPANRQAVLRWLDSMDLAAGPQLSPYIMQAAGFSDDAGSEIIMAIDLRGAFSWERGAKYVDAKKTLLEKYNVDVKDVANLLGTLRGIRMGIRLNENPFGKITIDFGDEVKLPGECAKQVVLEVFADLGVLIPEFEKWACDVEGTTISISGTMTRDGLRRIGSLIDSPAPTNAVEDEKYASPGDKAQAEAEASKKVLRSRYRDVQRHPPRLARSEDALQRFGLLGSVFPPHRQTPDPQR